ncbi:hypothetical protein N7470_001699 [Penicillium chermesinum]|nr:hypothetical protein N7470_001699 [Penicillium chermesinum]
MGSRTAKTDRRVKDRSRNGCENCRRSKVKCDEQKPSCTRCWQKGIPCSKATIQLKWESDYHERGIAFGRSGLWGKHSDQRRKAHMDSETSSVTPLGHTPVHAWTFLNSEMPLFERFYDEDLGCSEPRLLPAINTNREDDTFGYSFPPPSSASYSSSSSPSSLGLSHCQESPGTTTPQPPPALSFIPSLYGLGNQLLFDYYVNQICPRTVPSPTSRSPFASVILPYLVSASPSVGLALQLKSKVLRDLNQQISTDKSSLLNNDPEILVIIMMLCLYGIVDHCDHKWIIHLQGAKDLIRLRKTHRHSTESSPGERVDPVSSFAELFFAFQDVMGRTACAKADLFGPKYWDENDTNINEWMGCSPALVSILFAVMDLSKSRRHMTSDKDQVQFSIKAAALNNTLQTLKQSHSSYTEDGIIQRIADLKQLTCTVYLHCALYGGRPTDTFVRSRVRTILNEILSLLEQESACHVIWPIFVAAVELDPLENDHWENPIAGESIDGRRLVLELLTRMARVSVSSVTRARVVIEQVWQARDFNISRGFEAKVTSMSEVNDWERYVVPVSDALSLV